MKLYNLKSIIIFSNSFSEKCINEFSVKVDVDTIDLDTCTIFIETKLKI
jgi:hypothetical protein